VSLNNINCHLNQWKTVVFILLYFVSAIAYAQDGTENIEQQPEPQTVNQDEVQPGPDGVKRGDTQAEKTETENESYEIYKKINPDDPCDRGLDTYDYEKSWYDETQIYVNSSFCEPALWFDNFFGNERVFLEGSAGTYIRWRNEFIYNEEEYFSFNSDLTFSVELPGMENRLRLTFESDADENLRDISPDGNQTNSILGLQLDVKENERSKFNISISLSPRIRLRYRYTYPVGETVTLRFTQELQREEAVNSARSLFDFEKLFRNQLFFRSSSEGKVSEEYDGVDWLQAFVLFQRINKKASLAYEISANGITEPLVLATNYRVGIRFRKNFHRKWLFYEVVPELTWPVTLDEERLEITKNRRSVWAVIFRLEVHFGNAYKKRYEDHI
jgi:hypothetical protein